MKFQIATALLVVALVAFQAATASAFQTTAAMRRHDTIISSSTRKQRIMMVASPLSNNEETSDLSSLVSDMLTSHRESVDVEDLVPSSDTNSFMPQPTDDGIYHIRSQEQYENFLVENADKLVVLKFSSPFCQACRKLKQKFRQYSQDTKFEDVVFGDISVNKNLKKMNVDASSFFHFVTAQLKVTRIPYIHFYGECTGDDCRLVDSFAYNDRLVDSFACDVEDGCSWQTLKEKMSNFATATMKLHQDQQQQTQQRPTIKKRILNFFNFLNKNKQFI